VTRRRTVGYAQIVSHLSRKLVAPVVVLLAASLLVACPRPGQRPGPPAVEGYQGVATGRQGAVASAEANASDVGIAILKRGGNAVDAAVAVAFALGVTHPTAGNIGGGGFMVIRLPDGTSTAIDYREMAPGAASRDMNLDASGTPTPDSRIGPRAAGIPGVVRGLESAHRKFGKLPWRELVEPAVQLARDGVVLDSFHADEMAAVTRAMADIAGKVPEDKRSLREGMAATLGTFRQADGTSHARSLYTLRQHLSLVRERHGA